MGFPLLVRQGKIFRSWALAETGELAEGGAELRKGIGELRAIGTEFGLPSSFALLGEVCGRDGEVQDGLAAIEDGLVMADKNGDHFSLPELHRVKGDMLLARSAENYGEAVACFKRAMGIAASQKGKLLELRSAVSLAKLWGENKERSEARDLLAPVYGWFTEGFDTPDLKDAKALLDELS